MHIELIYIQNGGEFQVKANFLLYGKNKKREIEKLPGIASTYYDVQKLVEGNTPPLQTSAGVFG